MSEFKCSEPGCDYQVGFAGAVVTDEDYELQDSYFQEIEEHQQMHERGIGTRRVTKRERAIRWLRSTRSAVGEFALAALAPLIATAVVVLLFIPLFLWGMVDPIVPQVWGGPAALVLAGVWWAVFLPLREWLS